MNYSHTGALPSHFSHATNRFEGDSQSGIRENVNKFLKRRRKIPSIGAVFIACLVFIACSFVGLSVSDKRESPTTQVFSRKEALGVKRLFPAPDLENLILVAGHAVYVGRDYSEAAKESRWFLETYQNVTGEASSFIEHIRLGVKAAAEDPRALLLFSGGETRRQAGPRSEGASYWVVAEAAEWFGSPDVRNRTFTEEHARDSFENLLFSLCRFYELTGHYPSRVTVVSYSLKRARFEQLHRDAVRFAADRFAFIGTELPPDVHGAKEGEARTVEAFLADPYGCLAPLSDKKLQRDPFAVGPPHPSRCPAMAPLLNHCAAGGAAGKKFHGRVPWLS